MQGVTFKEENAVAVPPCRKEQKRIGILALPLGGHTSFPGLSTNWISLTECGKFFKPIGSEPAASVPRGS